MIDLSSEKLTGWDNRRGNFTETVFDKYKFAELILSECKALIDDPELIDKINNHFELTGNKDENTQASVPLGW